MFQKRFVQSMAGLERNQHTYKACCNGPPVRGGHALFENGHRQHGNQHGRNKEQGVGAGQGQIAHAPRERRQSDKPEHAAQKDEMIAGAAQAHQAIASIPGQIRTGVQQALAARAAAPARPQ